MNLWYVVVIYFVGCLYGFVVRGVTLPGSALAVQDIEVPGRRFWTGIGFGLLAGTLVTIMWQGFVWNYMISQHLKGFGAWFFYVIPGATPSFIVEKYIKDNLRGSTLVEDRISRFILNGVLVLSAISFFIVPVLPSWFQNLFLRLLEST